MLRAFVREAEADLTQKFMRFFFERVGDIDLAEDLIMRYLPAEFEFGREFGREGKILTNDVLEYGFFPWLFYTRIFLGPEFNQVGLPLQRPFSVGEFLIELSGKQL